MIFPFSLEPQVQMKVANPKVNLGCLDSTRSDTDNLLGKDACRPTVSNKNSHESSGTEANPPGLASENANCLNLNNGVADVGPDAEEKSACLEEGSVVNVVQPDHSVEKNVEGSKTEHNGISLELSESEEDKILKPSEKEVVEAHGPSETVAPAAVGPIELEIAEDLGTSVSEMVADLGPCESQRMPCLAVNDTHSRSMMHSNGFTPSQFVFHSENGHNHGTKLPDPLPTSKQTNGFQSGIRTQCTDGGTSSCEDTVAINLPPGKANSVSADSEIICMYRCCTECLSILHVLMQKILTRTLELNGSDWTVEDVHDVVASLSVDLLSAVRKVYLDTSSSISEENIILENPGNRFGCSGIDTCSCKRSGNGLVAIEECTYHTVGDGKSTENAEFGHDPTFVFRDGVLVSVDSNKEVSFHCKFEKLCLCSLIKSIVGTKQLID